MGYGQLKTFYHNRRVFVTGHTGFKGTWLCAVLLELGAEVTGYSLEPPTTPSLFELTNMQHRVCSFQGDIRNLQTLEASLTESCPDIVIHMAAQPLVRESYKNPVGTYETNVMGTVNLLEGVRRTSSVKSVVNVTTDKVYRNNEWDRGYIETDVLDGYDPYSNSKSCSELITHCYIQSFLDSQGIATSTCRAGNVIGGGDFSADRIIPDCVRAVLLNRDIVVRNANSTRPYQHVLEPLLAYLLIAKEQYENQEFAGCYNVGPEDVGCLATGELVELFCDTWKRQVPGSYVKWVNRSDGGPHEANFLKLDCTRLKEKIAWSPKWLISEAVEKVVEFEKIRVLSSSGTKHDLMSERLYSCMQKQIKEYIN